MLCSKLVKQEKRTGSVIKEKNPKKKLENFVRASKLTAPEYLTVRKMFSLLERNTKKWLGGGGGILDLGV